MERWIWRREKSTPWKGVALALITEAYNRADGRGGGSISAHSAEAHSVTYVARRDPSAENVTVPMSVVGALSTHRHLVLPKSHRRREGGLPDCAVARMLPSGLWTQGSKEHNTEATSVTNPSSSHSPKYRHWFSRLSKDAASRAHLSAIATTSAVWPEKCRWGRAVVGVGPADAVLGSTMTAPTSTRHAQRRTRWR